MSTCVETSGMDVDDRTRIAQQRRRRVFTQNMDRQRARLVDEGHLGLHIPPSCFGGCGQMNAQSIHMPGKILQHASAFASPAARNPEGRLRCCWHQPVNAVPCASACVVVLSTSACIATVPVVARACRCLAYEMATRTTTGRHGTTSTSWTPRSKPKCCVVLLCAIFAGRPRLADRKI